MVADGLRDDPSIANETELWRRIPPSSWLRDERRPTSEVFRTDEMSVVIAAECAGGLDGLLRGREEFGIAAFTAGAVREAGWGVVRDPTDEQLGHALVTGKKGKTACARLAKSCVVRREPAVSPTQPSE
jgi:hypothetical protein